MFAIVLHDRDLIEVNVLDTASVHRDENAVRSLRATERGAAAVGTEVKVNAFLSPLVVRELTTAGEQFEIRFRSEAEKVTTADANRAVACHHLFQI